MKDLESWYIHPIKKQTFVLDFGYDFLVGHPVMSVTFKSSPYKHAFIDFNKKEGYWKMKKFYYVHIEYDIDRPCRGLNVDKTINCRNLEHCNKVLQYWKNVKDRNVLRAEPEISYVAELDNGLCFSLNLIHIEACINKQIEKIHNIRVNGLIKKMIF